MPHPHRDTIEHWVSDFMDTPAAREHASVVQEYAPEVLVRFLEAACSHSGSSPADLEEDAMRPGLMNGVAPLEIPGSVRERLPSLCAAFLATMQAQGRLAGGEQLGRYVKALREPFLRAASGKGETIRSAGSKLGRNDPCPCGSGRKYKKCCMNA